MKKMIGFILAFVLVNVLLGVLSWGAGDISFKKAMIGMLMITTSVIVFVGLFKLVIYLID